MSKNAGGNRDRLVMILGGVGVAVIVVGIVLAGVLGARAKQPGADPNAALPKGAIAKTYGFAINGVDAAKSTLTIWEDPQCPYCGLFEKANGQAIATLAKSGVVNVVYQMAAFLDDGLPQSKQSSRRAIGALGCAADQGFGEAFHIALYNAQPENEGDGWSDDALKLIGAVAGLTGDVKSRFESCVDDGTYLRWADNGTQAFRDAGIPGTPYAQLDGKVLPDNIMDMSKTSPAQFVDYITKNAK